MTGRNRGNTSLKRSYRTRDPMREHDRLPEELRRWLAGAVLPWAARSAWRAYGKALRRTGDPALALRELDRLQARLIARDAARVWGPAHPMARQG